MQGSVAEPREPNRIPVQLRWALYIVAVAIVTVPTVFILANVLDAWWLIPTTLQGAGILLVLPLGAIGAILLMVIAGKTHRPWLWWTSLVALTIIAVFAVFIVYLFWLLQDV